MQTIKGPGIFLAQFAGDAAPYNSLPAICKWAKEKGLYNEVYPDIKAMDTALDELTLKLASYHPEALIGLKQILWEGTADWDELLNRRAAISGELVLSEFTQQALQGFLKKQQ